MKTIGKFISALVLMAVCSSLIVLAQDFEALGKEVVNELVARQFDKVELQFDEQMKAALPITKLPEVWDSILAQAGPFKSIFASRAMERQGLHAAIVTCEFERAMLDAKIFMDAHGTVKGLFFEPASSSPGGPAELEEWKTPSYAKADAFHERSTTIISGRWELPGVLTLPNSKTGVPALVLIQGSGPQD